MALLYTVNFYVASVMVPHGGEAMAAPRAQEGRARQGSGGGGSGGGVSRKDDYHRLITTLSRTNVASSHTGVS